MSGEANPLVAEQESRSWSTGMFLVDDLHNTCTDIGSNNWVSTGLEAAPTAIDTVAALSDPIGTLVAMGFGWLIDHIDPLKSWLDELAGNPQAVDAMARTYANIAHRLAEEQTYIQRRLHDDLEGCTADFLTAYAGQASHVSDTIGALADAASVTGEALGVLAGLVDAVHGLVRDAISQIVGSVASAGLEEVFSLGLATPLVVEQVSSKVSALSARISTFIHDLSDTVKALGALIKKIEGLLQRIEAIMQKLHMATFPEHRKPWSESSPRDPHAADHAPRHAAEPKTTGPTDTAPGKHRAVSVDHVGNVRAAVGDSVKEMPKDEIPADVWAEGTTAVANYIQAHGYAASASNGAGEGR